MRSPAWRRSAGDQPDKPVGASRSTSEHQQPDEQEAILRERREQFRQQHDDERADDRAEHRSAPPTITTSRNRID